VSLFSSKRDKSVREKRDTGISEVKTSWVHFKHFAGKRDKSVGEPVGGSLFSEKRDTRAGSQ